MRWFFVRLVVGLVLGGGVLCSCAISVAPESRALPATGQTQCYDRFGNVIACGSADYPVRTVSTRRAARPRGGSPTTVTGR